MPEQKRGNSRIDGYGLSQFSSLTRLPSSTRIVALPSATVAPGRERLFRSLALV